MEDVWEVPDVTTGHGTANNEEVVPKHQHKLKHKGGKNEKDHLLDRKYEVLHCVKLPVVTQGRGYTRTASGGTISDSGVATKPRRAHPPGERIHLMSFHQHLKEDARLEGTVGTVSPECPRSPEPLQRAG